jgi:hypothetical protein
MFLFQEVFTSKVGMHLLFYNPTFPAFSDLTIPCEQVPRYVAFSNFRYFIDDEVREKFRVLHKYPLLFGYSDYRHFSFMALP